MEKAKEYYFVQTIDTWGIVTFIGLYDDLDKATKQVHETHDYIDGIENLQIEKRAGLYSEIFDTEYHCEESGEYVRVCGFIFYGDDDNGIFIEVEE